MTLPGYATAEGTTRFRHRFPSLRDAGHFRRPENVPGVAELWMSSIGQGTYLGEADAAADQSYVEAVTAAVSSGVNVLDTAINYRHQRSERNIGAALKQLAAEGRVRRDEILVCTKGGYLSFDGNMPADPHAYFKREYIETGVLNPRELAGGMHCMAPAYLENQIERSRHNLGLETLDVFYVHNPESQLAEVARETFQQRLSEAFSMLEKQVRAGKLRFYGLATWAAFRVAEGARDYLNLFEMAQIARHAGGEHHHFRFIQLPFNLAMPEAYGLANQTHGRERMALLSAAARLGVVVIGSATLYQGHLTQGLPQIVGRILGLQSDAENAIQFSRSAPGLTTSLIGMGQKQHVSRNLKPALVPPTPHEDWNKLFTQH
jgi:aryl-alcohol dehydrogenase-like predicted oxidoreductase